MTQFEVNKVYITDLGAHRVTDIYISPANQQKYIVFDDEQVVKVTASEDGSEQVIIPEPSLLRILNANSLVMK